MDTRVPTDADTRVPTDAEYIMLLSYSFIVICHLLMGVLFTFCILPWLSVTLISVSIKTSKWLHLIKYIMSCWLHNLPINYSSLLFVL